MDININSQREVSQHNCLAKQLKQVLGAVISLVMGFDQANKTRHKFSPVQKGINPTKREAGSPSKKSRLASISPMNILVSIIAFKVHCCTTDSLYPSVACSFWHCESSSMRKELSCQFKIYFFLCPATRTYVFSVLGSCHLLRKATKSKSNGLCYFGCLWDLNDNKKGVICV